MDNSGIHLVDADRTDDFRPVSVTLLLSRTAVKIIVKAVLHEPTRRTEGVARPDGRAAFIRRLDSGQLLIILLISSAARLSGSGISHSTGKYSKEVRYLFLFVCVS